ncbi:hypothetical protein HZ326_20955 [Fusarium oxysporum f. sp. albedinis]|nr:hypothetical protein HZ326_20955 [Fusarium oxysporum f. sp. albedinis]
MLTYPDHTRLDVLLIECPVDITYRNFSRILRQFEDCESSFGLDTLKRITLSPSECERNFRSSSVLVSPS